jgi:transcriptional regulator with XRE-family HTH domain
MEKLKTHWTSRSTDDFLYRIGADFVRQTEQAMEATGTNQATLAQRLNVSEGRVSQVLNNPGNLTLRKIVEYARALGRKVAIVQYDDDDPQNLNGPINAEIFNVCWQKAGMPSDFFDLEDAATTSEYIITADLASFSMLRIHPSRKVGNDVIQSLGTNRSASNTQFQEFINS